MCAPNNLHHVNPRPGAYGQLVTGGGPKHLRGMPDDYAPPSMNSRLSLPGCVGGRARVRAYKRPCVHVHEVVRPLGQLLCQYRALMVSKGW